MPTVSTVNMVVIIILSLNSSVVKPLAALAKGSGFNSLFAQHVQRFIISQAFTYHVVGSLVLSWSWA